VTPLVVDASAYVHVATAESSAARAAELRMLAAECHAPHLLDAEVGSALRQRVAAGTMHPGLAQEALLNSRAVVERRHPHDDLILVAWALRTHVSFYDALYVALAAALDAPLLTADGRLARAHGLPCAVEQVV
jgi:predicted nucleic acid-binding protein